MKLIIVDDSLTYRLILKEVLRHVPQAEVVATAVHGQDALAKLEELNGNIQLMLLDLQMPVMDGMETLDAMRKHFPYVDVVVVSGLNTENADLTIQALEKGAIDFIRKPDHAEADENFDELRRQMEFIVSSCLKKNPSIISSHTSNAVVVASQPNDQQPASTRTKSKPRHKIIEAVTIGISTGGPAALLGLIPKLPANLRVPILIVQHMPPMFTRSLAESLQAKSGLRVREAEAEEIIQPGTVYIAPGGIHMTVRSEAGQTRIMLCDTPPENSCKPAVDVLFRSMAEVYGGRTLALIMTGMGNDGALGMQKLKQEGAYCLSQTADSCVIYGMPRAVDEMGLPDEHVALEDLPARISQLVCSGQ